jgi:hypothetical protein
MMATREDIERYLIQMEQPFDTIEPNIWIIRDTVNVVVTYEPPLVVFRAKVMETPNKNREEFFKLLLNLNATQMIHGAYGLEDGIVVLIDTLQYENLDFNEFQATFDALSLALSQDYEKLRPFAG